jgi:hypothetical protein
MKEGQVPRERHRPAGSRDGRLPSPALPVCTEPRGAGVTSPRLAQRHRFRGREPRGSRPASRRPPPPPTRATGASWPGRPRPGAGNRAPSRVHQDGTARWSVPCDRTSRDPAGLPRPGTAPPPAPSRCPSRRVQLIGMHHHVGPRLVSTPADRQESGGRRPRRALPPPRLSPDELFWYSRYELSAANRPTRPRRNSPGPQGDHEGVEMPWFPELRSNAAELWRG